MDLGLKFGYYFLGIGPQIVLHIAKLLIQVNGRNVFLG